MSCNKIIIDEPNMSDKEKLDYVIAAHKNCDLKLQKHHQKTLNTLYKLTRLMVRDRMDDLSKYL